MGKSNSKNSITSDNPQVQVLNQLEWHEEQHNEHDFKITIILVLVAIQLSITIYRLYKDHTKVQALKAAKSLAHIDRV